MKKKFFYLFIILLLAFWSSPDMGWAQISPGKPAPTFSLLDLKGRSHDLAQMKTSPMVILYFFDVDSRPSQEGLLSLNQLAKKYKEAQLIVWAITTSPPEKAMQFANKGELIFPVLLDKGKVSQLYQAQVVLPAVCVIGPGLKVLDYFQGGGKTTEIMLVRVAERKLQQKQTMVAKAISQEVVKKNPQNLKAKTVKAYAALKEEKLKEAEKDFKDLTQEGKEGEVLGKEGLAVVYAKKGQADQALKMAKEVEGQDPQRAFVHVVKGDLLYAQDKKKEAEAEYQLAIRKEKAEPYQAALLYNQMGRYYATLGKYDKAREFYDQAVTIDPYYIEGTTNKGLTYEKEGKWDKALEAYRQTLALDKKDTFAVVLAKKAQEMLEIQKDAEKKKRLDQLVKDLAARYRSQVEAKPKVEDTWTSQSMVLSFVDFQEKGGLAERDGFSSVLLSQLTEHLNNSGRVRVVERVLIERLLEELNLGSSDLANPETSLKLGRVLAAKLIGTGFLFYLPQGTLLNLRLIDTETSAIPQVLTRQLASQITLEKDLFQLNREILKTVILKYPLRGYLAKVSGEEVIINIGAKQGVVPGTKFDVLEEGESLTYRGKVLHAAPKVIGQIEIVRVEPDMAVGKIIKKEKPLQVDAKVQEKIEDNALK